MLRYIPILCPHSRIYTREWTFYKNNKLKWAFKKLIKYLQDICIRLSNYMRIIYDIKDLHEIYIRRRTCMRSTYDEWPARDIHTTNDLHEIYIRYKGPVWGLHTTKNLYEICMRPAYAWRRSKEGPTCCTWGCPASTNVWGVFSGPPHPQTLTCSISCYGQSTPATLRGVSNHNSVY